MVLELEPASFAFSRESPMDCAGAEVSFFLQDLRIHFEFGRNPILKYLQNCMIQICTAPKEDKTMPLTFQNYDT